MQIDAPRALILARAEQLRMPLAEISRKVGANHAYLQQFIRRGIPRVLPEDMREALAAVLQVSADALRGEGYGKGGPRPPPPEALAASSQERELLRLYRQLDEAGKAKAIAILTALSGP